MSKLTIDKTDGTDVSVDGIRLTIITPATKEEAVARFVAACERDVEELGRLAEAREERRKWNFANPGKGKNWPAFRALERKLDELCKEAGIKDS